MSPLGGPLLASARSRLTIAGAAILLLWIAVLWAVLSEPNRKAAVQNAAPEVHALRLVVASGQAAPVSLATCCMARGSVMLSRNSACMPSCRILCARLASSAADGSLLLVQPLIASIVIP